MPRASGWRQYRPSATGVATGLAAGVKAGGHLNSAPTRAPIKARILGLDPGSRATGFGIIDVDASGSVYGPVARYARRALILRRDFIRSTPVWRV